MTTAQSALAGKTALDTGGGTGIAEATAKTLEQVLDLGLR
jgi:short-subunit dehydrogenase involved in D-alanine esterification of teichoic acids